MLTRWLLRTSNFNLLTNMTNGIPFILSVQMMNVLQSQIEKRFLSGKLISPSVWPSPNLDRTQT